jgi:hypothetical protein
MMVQSVCVFLFFFFLLPAERISDSMHLLMCVHSCRRSRSVVESVKVPWICSRRHDLLEYTA